MNLNILSHRIKVSSNDSSVEKLRFGHLGLRVLWPSAFEAQTEFVVKLVDIVQKKERGEQSG